MSISNFRIFVLIVLTAASVVVSYIAKTDITLAFSTIGFVLAADWWAQSTFIKIAFKQQKGKENVDTRENDKSE